MKPNLTATLALTMLLFAMASPALAQSIDLSPIQTLPSGDRRRHHRPTWHRDWHPRPDRCLSLLALRHPRLPPGAVGPRCHRGHRRCADHRRCNLDHLRITEMAAEQSPSLPALCVLPN